jgi:hypothetical protein
MGCCAGFHTDQAGSKLLEERLHLPASQRLSQDNLPVRINSMKLENILCDIKSNCRNLGSEQELFPQTR